jgi:hypothetical protein
MMSLMKRSALATAALLVMAAGASAATIEVKVPFPFTVHGQVLPAGQYLVRTAEMGSSAVVIQGERGTKGAAVFLTEPMSGKDPAGAAPALTFTHRENAYQLVDIWQEGGSGLMVE